MKKTVYSYDDGEYYDNGRKINWEEVEATNNQDLLSFILERGNNDEVSWYAAENPNCPSAVLAKVLERGKDDGVSWNVAFNPNCPSEALVKILERGNEDMVSYYAAFNSNCPPESLAKVLERGKGDGVSMYAAQNPNCPVEAKMKWYYTLNKNIDSEEKRIDDEDVLKKLISV